MNIVGRCAAEARRREAVVFFRGASRFKNSRKLGEHPRV
jgi:hypothetical protein